nr:MAG TPA: hypothetical protein [Caudoviricetes sp.]
MRPRSHRRKHSTTSGPQQRAFSIPGEITWQVKRLNQRRPKTVLMSKVQKTLLTKLWSERTLRGVRPSFS